MTSLPIWWDLYRYRPVNFHQCQRCVLHCHHQRQHRRWRRFRCRRAFLVPYYVCVYHTGTNSKMLSPSEASSSHEAPSQSSGRPFCAFVRASAQYIFHPIYFAKARFCSCILLRVYNSEERLRHSLGSVILRMTLCVCDCVHTSTPAGIYAVRSAHCP